MTTRQCLLDFSLIRANKKQPATNRDAVRAMSDGDISAVMQIQAACYPPSMLESEAVFRARLALPRAANTLVATALKHAQTKELRWSALVSVQQSQPFWSTLGYAPVEVLHSPARESLASYQPGSLIDAVYMLQLILSS